MGWPGSLSKPVWVGRPRREVANDYSKLSPEVAARAIKSAVIQGYELGPSAAKHLAENPHLKGVLPGITPWKYSYQMEHAIDQGIARDWANKIDIVLEGKQLAHEKQYLERLEKDSPIGGGFDEAHAQFAWKAEALGESGGFARGLSEGEKAGLVELLHSPGAWNANNTPGGDHKVGRWNVEIAVADVVPKERVGEGNVQVSPSSNASKSEGLEWGGKGSLTFGPDDGPVRLHGELGATKSSSETTGSGMTSTTGRSAPAIEKEGNIVVRLTDGITEVEMVMPRRQTFVDR